MKLNRILISCLVLLLALTLTLKEAGASTVDLRFANYSIDCTGSPARACYTVQIMSGDSDFRVGNATIFLTYNAGGITNPIETPLNFDTANGYGFDPQMSFLETVSTGSALGEINYAITLSDGAGGGTPTITSSAWVDVVELCFDIVDNNQSADLNFVIGNPIGTLTDDYTGFNSDDNIRANSHTVGNASPLDPNLECPLEVNLKVLLEGPHIAGTQTMTTALQNNSLSGGTMLPLRQPYTAGPWNHTFSTADPARGSEALSALPSNMTDWVLVSASTDGTTGGVIETRAGTLMSNGNIEDPNVSGSPLLFYNLTSGASYTFIIRHRNHLDVATPAPLTVPVLTPYEDLLDATGEFYSSLPQTKNIGGTTFAMRGGDINQDNFTNGADDAVWIIENTLFFEYYYTDLNMDGFVNGTDEVIWRLNNSQFMPPLIFP